MKKTILLILLIVAIHSCKENIVSKPNAYYRLTFPDHKYQTYDTTNCPYTFEYPIYSRISPSRDSKTNPCWINIDFPQYKAHFHITLRKISNNIDSLFDDSHTLVYKHVVKADAITPKDYINDSLKVYATTFFIEGNAASPLQFHITDSIKYFIRGSVYFEVSPNADSLSPAINFITEDALNLIETFEWKK